MPRPSPPRLTLGLLLAAVLAYAGCNNTLDPYSGDVLYSIRGYLDLDRTRQYVRVGALEEAVLGNPSEEMDARVTLYNLTAGTQEVLQDSVIAFDEGTVTHNFWTAARVQGDARYRLRVERSDGAVTEAETTTPTARPPRTLPDSANCLTQYRVVFEDADEVFDTSVGYHYGGTTHWINKRYEVRAVDTPNPYIRFLPEADLAPIVGPVDNPNSFKVEVRCSELDDGQILVAFTYVSPNWTGQVPPGEPIDTTPLASTTIENGIGFFGAVRQDTVAVTVSTALYVD